MMSPPEELVEEVPHGSSDPANQPGGSFAVGTGSHTQAPGGCAHRYLLPSAPCPCPFVWPWRGGPAPGHSRWSSGPLEGGNTLRGARDAPLAPGSPGTSVAQRLPPRTDSRCAVCRAAPPRLWCHRTQRPACLCALDPLAPSGYDDHPPVWGRGGGGPPDRRACPAPACLWA